MNEYRHHVSGFFVLREDAESTLTALIDCGLPRERLFIFEKNSAPAIPGPHKDSQEVRNEVITDGAIGVAAGVGLGALGEVALVAADVSLFIASPLLAPLMMMGWGAVVGGLIGASAGARNDKDFKSLLSDAVSNGQIVLVVETRTKEETATARDFIQAAVSHYNDVSTKAA